ncbi:pro-opiomelanocortin-like [Limanda limanda]|uniref:pro-opiomelanocortin-like n=1 Tax=Limanda limanda TaxID=27771 RepID=UPI0029C94B41|nr:pro-opiomelanocortin-like [Limanda limanda]
MHPVWLLVAVTVVGVVSGDDNQCWEHPSCQEVNDERSMMECIQLCRPDLPPEASSPSSAPPAKRSYSMEHFRWGKPVGRKRRPVKVYASDGVEEESAEVFPDEMLRRELPAAEDQETQEKKLHDVHQKKDSTYKMKHFRWSGPPESKRYGGFVKSWDDRHQGPLLTLFQNEIMDEDQETTGEQGGEIGAKR